MSGMKKIRRLLILLGLLFVAGCTGAPSTLAPASTSAAVITDLMKFVFGVAAVVFVIVEGLLLFAILKYRYKVKGRLSKEELPEQVEGNRYFETAWIIAPSIVLVIIFVISVVAFQSIINLPGPSPIAPGAYAPVSIRVVGHQYWWEFEYPELNISTANEYHIPTNTVIVFALESADVIHSFWVPQLEGKTDAIPGRVNHTWFSVTKPGTYSGQCAEFCGEGHAEMRFTVFAETPDEFNAWVKQQQSPPPVMTGVAAQGEKLFMQGSCTSCHAVRGTEAKGMDGPDLTHFASRQIFSGGIFKNDAANLAQWLADPPATKPGTQMPNLGLSPDEVKALIAYLQNLK